MAPMTYVAALADASFCNNQQDALPCLLFQKTLEMMEKQLDYQILTNIFLKFKF